MKILLFAIGSIFLLCTSCLYNDTAITEDLGNGYFYLGAANESRILLGNEKRNSGVTIVPQVVIEYNFNKKYIIAKSKVIVPDNRKQLYWIVNKEQKQDSVIELDSISFYKKLEELSININLKPRK
ncbi:MAG: hypothetical protein ACO1OF_15235 [Adhaeribacter sp.]